MQIDTGEIDNDESLSQLIGVGRTEVDDVYKTEGNTLFYELGDDVVELTNKGGALKAMRRLLQVLGKRRLETLGFPSDDIIMGFKLRQNPLEEIKIEEIVNKIPVAGEIEELGGDELVRLRL